MPARTISSSSGQHNRSKTDDTGESGETYDVEHDTIDYWKRVYKNLLEQ